MPVNWSNYPPDWRAQAARRRIDRAHDQCECTGQCGLHTGHRCTETHHRPASYARGLTRLSNAHLCQCHPLCNTDPHILVCCQRCHLRIDRELHRRTRYQNNHHLQIPIPF